MQPYSPENTSDTELKPPCAHAQLIVLGILHQNFSIFFATYNDRGGFNIQFGLCSVKNLLSGYGDMAVLIFQIISFLLPYQLVYSIPIGASHVTCTFALKDYNSITTLLIYFILEIKHVNASLLALLVTYYHAPINITFLVHFCQAAIVHMEN